MKRLALLLFTMSLFSQMSFAAARDDFTLHREFSIDHTIYNEKLQLACYEPMDLHPSARAMVKEYLKGNILNSTFLADFLWLHPEYEQYLNCVICASERPNDGIWEADFDVTCPGITSQYHLNNEDFHMADILALPRKF